MKLTGVEGKYAKQGDMQATRDSAAVTHLDSIILETLLRGKEDDEEEEEEDEDGEES